MALLLSLALLMVAPVPADQPVASVLAVLHQWDQQREAAWAASDPASLRGLYVRGSPAGRADARLLQEYAARRLVVRRIRTQVFAAEVVDRTPRRLVVRVLDRVAGGEVVGPDGVTPLGTSPPRRRTVVLVSNGRTWRVAGISASGSGPRSARR